MRNRTVKHKNISRVDHEPSRTHGYSVRVQWQGQRRAKFFADGKYGDRLASFFAALDWRNMVEKELGKPRTERQVLGVTNSPSGITGVRRRREGDTEYYEATWATSAGKQARTKYSIARHGEKRALQLAKQARKRGEQERLRTPARNED